MIERARAERHDVLAAQYRYTAGSTTLAAMVLKWAVEGSIKAMLACLGNPGTRVCARAEIAACAYPRASAERSR
jgi:N-acyl-D-amino-acid deacylase